MAMPLNSKRKILFVWLFVLGIAVYGFIDIVCPAIARRYPDILVALWTSVPPITLFRNFPDRDIAPWVSFFAGYGLIFIMHCFHGYPGLLLWPDVILRFLGAFLMLYPLAHSSDRVWMRRPAK